MRGRPRSRCFVRPLRIGVMSCGIFDGLEGRGRAHDEGTAPSRPTLMRSRVFVGLFSCELCDVCSCPALARSLRVTKNCFLTSRSRCFRAGWVRGLLRHGMPTRTPAGESYRALQLAFPSVFSSFHQSASAGLALDGLTIENDERDETRGSGRRSVVCRRAPLQLHWDPGEWTRSGARAHRKGARLNQPVGRRDAWSTQASQLMG